MIVNCKGSWHPDLLGIKFNQNSSCLALATMQGPIVYNLGQEQVSYKDEIGAIGILSMLYESAFLVYVGAGEQTQLSPRKLVAIDGSRKGTKVAEEFCDTAILDVLLNMKWMVIVLEESLRILRLKSMSEAQVIQTPPNSLGVGALSSNDLLAVPASTEKGTIRVYNLNQVGNLLCEIEAHNHPLRAVCWNADGSLLATASQQGTVIRVFKMPLPTQCSFTFRSGIQKTEIFQLAFSPSEIMPPLLCASTSRGEVVLFRLIDAARSRVQSLTQWIPSQVQDIVGGELPWLTLKLPGEVQKLPAACGIYIDKDQRKSTIEEGISEDEGEEESYKEPVNVVVGTAKGEVHVYSIEDVRSIRGPQHQKRSRLILEGSQD
eukprot:TRINITY_DN18303_c0_g1_i1.p1 TRINITY_DN18303_c0_g1~~TRINITY_DN18303_c0_g1_i1.p1  ORF type:complete len:410 (-),score=69.74 TRINITY_DN18303_c0_g1_i1:252-1379(-)